MFVTKHDAKFYFPYPAVGPFSRRQPLPRKNALFLPLSVDLALGQLAFLVLSHQA